MWPLISLSLSHSLSLTLSLSLSLSLTLSLSFSLYEQLKGTSCTTYAQAMRDGHSKLPSSHLVRS
jgi:hypothetical protein